MLGQTYIRNFIKWFINNSETFFIARDSQRVVGYIFGAPSGYATEMNRALLSIILWSVLTHPRVLFDARLVRQIRSRIRSVIRPPYRTAGLLDAYLDGSTHIYRLTAIGVSPLYRGQGIGRLLLKTYEQSVWKLGFDQIQLSVYSSNLEARTLYESCGWILVSDNARLMVFAKHRIF